MEEERSTPAKNVPTPAEAILIRRLFDQLPAMVAFWDAEARNVVANDAYLEWFGWTPEKLRGRHISELLGPAIYQANLPFISAALAGEEQLFDRTLVDTYGRTRHTQAHYVPEVVDGEVRGFFVLVADVTRLVQAERDLAEVQQLARLGSWTQQGIDGEITWSEEMYRITGMEPGTPLSRETIQVMIHPDDLERVLTTSDATVQAAQDSAQYFRIVRPDGEVRHLHARSQLIFREGEVVGRRGTLVDETEAWRATAELATANDLLRRRNELMADIVSLIGHDLRQPAAGIHGYLELIQRRLDSGSTEGVSDLVERAQTATKRLSAMLDNTLGMAALDSDALVSHAQNLALAPLAQSTVDDLRLVEAVTVDIAADLRVTADPVQVQQILENLVTNAAKYGRPPISVSARSVGPNVEIRVADRGDGVPAEFVPRLFERFTRAEEAAPERPGTGLGLYIVNGICAANGGSIRYETGEQGGATFVVTLPRPVLRA